jgi:alpha-2-macroglobulin
MILTNLKWMALGMVITFSGVWVYNNSGKLFGSSQKQTPYQTINPEFAGYIQAFTAGYVSAQTTVKIKLSNEFGANEQLNKALDKAFFSFEPSLKGETVWKDAQTLEFKPAEKLVPGQMYKASFHLNELTEVKKELKTFEFSFKAIQQSVQTEINHLKSYHSNDYNYYSLSGVISTADAADIATTEQLLIANYEGKTPRIKWQHNDKSTQHFFLIDSIQRPKTGESILKLNCNGKALNVDYSFEKNLSIPSKSIFKLLDLSVNSDNEQYVTLSFSNPVDQYQSLESWLSIENMKDCRYIANNNQVFIYPNQLKSGSYTLKIGNGLRDTKSLKINEESEHAIVFTDVKPAVRFIGEGNILPSTNNLLLPFESVNLRAVDVKIIKIYENNVLQFLQSNELGGSGNMAQVGKKIIEKHINLGITNPADFSIWKKTHLDLSKLIQSEPGAIYRVFLSFKKAYSTYPCLGNTADDKFEMDELKADTEEDVNYFGYYYDDYYPYYDYEDNEEYNWRDRDNPCKSTYYMQYDRKVARNILASDIGLTVKKGNDGQLFVMASNLVTAEPMKGVTLEFYDYQKQLISTETTNGDGQVMTNPAGKISFIVAKKDAQRNYLRLDDGSTLSLSMYNVSGDAVKKGIKGFIYGERGVWRPGDSLYLNFILEDKQDKIPDNHPVVFEISNPQGQLYKRLFSNKSVDGFYNFSFATDQNAPTGLWNAEVRVGSVKFNKSVRIESIMPNRLKIEVNAGNNKLLSASGSDMISLHANWLTGAIAKNFPANVSVLLSTSSTQFEKYKDYHFDDLTKRFESESITLFDGKLDENGDKSFPLALENQNNAPGFLKASFTTRVFEPGGAFSIDRFTVPYSPYSHYAGIKLPGGEKNTGILYTNKDHFIQIASVNHLGQASNRELKFELYKMEWRWWWDQYNDELANYANDDYYKPVQTNYVNSNGGIAQVRVHLKDNEWGRYLVKVTDVKSGHVSSLVTYFDWPNWMDRDGGNDNKIMANMLKFTTDKIAYKSGEEVKLNIPSPEKGRALVTIENGSRVLEAHWVNTEKGNTKFSFKIKPEMAPNVYVHVSLMQPHAHANDLPIRMYGVMPVAVDDPETHLKPLISMPNELMPEQNVNIQVSEENGKEMAFTIAVVDEGLLDITRFKTPNPWNSFYSKEALGVKTWDSYDQVIGAFGAELERILSIGGDGSEIGDDGAKANRFKPMVKFFGPFHVNKNNKQTIAFKMPMYVGSVRTMVIAGYKGAYGMAEKTTAVKAPLMILGTLPRVLSVSEEVKLPVSVFGGSKAVGKTEVKIECNDLLQISGGNNKSISVGKDEEKLLSFNLKAKNKTGIARVKITASGGGHTSSYDIELDVRNPNPTQTTVQDFWVESGKTLNQSIKPMGIEQTLSSVVEISTIPPVNLDERLNYLITYPHGCIEQTTSQSFAQLYLSDIMTLEPERLTAIEQNIKAGLNEIRKFQLANGAMSYWQGLQEPNDWGTSYAGHFMICAEKKGYTLPAGIKKQWLNFQQNAAQNFELSKNKFYSNDVLQAYRLYVLALAKQPVMSAMNRLREYANLSNESRWLLAGAYALSGQIDESEKLLASASVKTNPYRFNPYTYGSSERDMAIVLDVLCLMNKKQQAFAQLKKVSSFLSSNSWLSTQTTAYGLVAISSFIKKFGDASALQAQVTLGGKAINLKGNAAITQIPVDLKQKNKELLIQNNGKGSLYVRVINRGKPAIGSESEGNENISMTYEYLDASGNVTDPEEIEQGNDVSLRMTIRNLGLSGDIKNIALTNNIPSGWEIHNTRMDEGEQSTRFENYTYRDIRDDKVLTYFDLGVNESKTFVLKLNASYEGRFYLPAINAEAMYDNNIFARSKGKWIKVIKQKEEKVAGK